LITILATRSSQTIELYLDGVFSAGAVGDLTVVKDQHKLLAVHVEDKNVDNNVYFVASSSNGFRTNRSLKCTNKYHQGWFLPNFRDASWPKPYADDKNKVVYFAAPDAKWITYLVTRSNKLFCRWNTTVGKHHPPEYLENSSSTYNCGCWAKIILVYLRSNALSSVARPPGTNK